LLLCYYYYYSTNHKRFVFNHAEYIVEVREDVSEGRHIPSCTIVKAHTEQ